MPTLSHPAAGMNFNTQTLRFLRSRLTMCYEIAICDETFQMTFTFKVLLSCNVWKSLKKVSLYIREAKWYLINDFHRLCFSTNVYSWFFTKGIQFKSFATPYAFSFSFRCDDNDSQVFYNSWKVSLWPLLRWITPAWFHKKTQRALFTVGYFQNWTFT